MDHDWLHKSFVSYMESKADDGITCGRYVIMPDHLHFFLRIDLHRFSLSKTIGFIKQHLGASLKNHGFEKSYWQDGFFDHIVRNSEQHALKNEYVLFNPVKADFVECPDDWVYSGKIRDLLF